MQKTILLVLLGLFPCMSQAFIFYTWNLKHLGRERMSVKNVASVIADADLVVIQEVNTSISGRQKLKEVRDATQRPLCMGVSKKPTNARERYGMLWNEAELVQVDEKGREIKCEENKFSELELTKLHASEIERESAYILLKEKKSGHLLIVATVHTLPNSNGKTPALEIPLVFEAVDAEAGRIKKQESLSIDTSIVAGDFNMSVRNKPFNRARELGYQAVLSSGPKTSLEKSKRELSEPYDNILVKSPFKKIHIDARVINLYKRFEDLEKETVYNNISDHCPIRAEVNLNP